MADLESNRQRRVLAHARQRARELIGIPAVREIIAGYCDHETSLEFALTCKSIFRHLGARQYRMIAYEDIRQMRKAMPSKKRHDIYLSGIHTVVITGQLPLLGRLSGISHLFDLCPAALHVEWLSGCYSRSSPTFRDGTISWTIESTHKFSFARTTDLDRMRRMEELVMPVGWRITSRYHLQIAKPCKMGFGAGLRGHISAGMFAPAESVYGAAYTSLDIDMIADGKDWGHHAFTEHLRKRTERNFPEYLSIKLEEPVQAQILRHVPSIAFFDAIVQYNPSLQSLHFVSQVRAPLPFPDVGTEQLLTRLEWHRLKELRHLTLMLELDCRGPGLPRIYSNRPECALFEGRSRAPCQAHTDEDTALPQQCRKLESLEVELHSHSLDPWMPDINFVAECLVAIAGPNCDITFRPVSSAMSDVCDGGQIRHTTHYQEGSARMGSITEDIQHRAGGAELKDAEARWEQGRVNGLTRFIWILYTQEQKLEG